MSKISKIFMPVIMLLSIVGTFFVYSYLPERIPTHWNAAGQINAYSAKPFVFVTALLPVLLYGLFMIIPKIDPKRQSYQIHKKAYDITILAIIIFIVGLHWVTVFAALGYKVNVATLVKAGVGILFIVIGNYLPQVKHNYFFGVRTPWTLADEAVWNKTNRLCGYLFAVLGLFLLLTSPINNTVIFIIFIVMVLGILIFTMLYSYLLFKKKN